MSKIKLAESLQQDINDLNAIFNYEKYGMTKEQAKLQARAVMANLESNIEELISE